MIGRLAGRAGRALLTLLGLAVSTFLLFEWLPSGDPAAARAGRNAPPEAVEQARRALGLDAPLVERLWDFLRDLVQLDLGESFLSGLPVSELVGERLPVSLSLIAGALVLGWAGGLAAGMLAAWRPNTRADRVIALASTAGVAVPAYVIGLVALIALPDPPPYTPLAESPLTWFRSLALAWLVLALPLAAVAARYTRAALRDALDEPFVDTALAKGVPARRLLVRHAMPPAGGLLLAVGALDAGAIVGSALVVEIVFDLPGLGTLALQAVQLGDLPAIEGTVLCAGAAVILANFAADLLHVVIDPRLRR